MKNMKQVSDITGLLEASNIGNEAALNDVFQLVYSELRRLAHSQRRFWNGDETLNTTALINEAYLKLTAQKHACFNNRSHFYSTAAKAMRQILVNYAERQHAAKRGGSQANLPLEDVLVMKHEDVLELLAIERLLEQLEQKHPRRSQVFECRVYGGMSNQETADELSISLATVKRDWNIAAAYIFRELSAHAVQVE